MKTLAFVIAACAAILLVLPSCQTSADFGEAGVIYTDRSVSLINLPGDISEATYNFPKGAPKTAFIKYDDGRVEWLTKPVGGGYVNGSLVVSLESGTRIYISKLGVRTEQAPAPSSLR